MGFRFRQKLHIAPGLDINLSKSGPSLTLGERGAHVTVGEHGVTESAGLPGTGLSYSHHDKLPGRLQRLAGAGGKLRHVAWIVIVVGIVVAKIYLRHHGHR